MDRWLCRSTSCASPSLLPRSPRTFAAGTRTRRHAGPDWGNQWQERRRGWTVGTVNPLPARPDARLPAAIFRGSISRVEQQHELHVRITSTTREAVVRERYKEQLRKNARELLSGRERLRRKAAADRRRERLRRKECLRRRRRQTGEGASRRKECLKEEGGGRQEKGASTEKRRQTG